MLRAKQNNKLPSLPQKMVLPHRIKHCLQFIYSQQKKSVDMKKIIIPTILLLACTSVVYAQKVENYEVLRSVDLYRQQKLIEEGGNNVLTESEIEGSPYLNKDFENGTIYTIGKTKFTEIPLRFNIYNDVIEFKTDDKIYTFTAPELVERIEFGGKTFIYAPYSILKKTKKGYFIVLETGTASLWMKPEIFFKNATQPAAYKDAEPAKFQRKPDTYFIKVGNEQAKLVSNKNDLTEILSDKKQEVEGFLKKNKVKTNNPEDLLKLIRFYNSL